MKKILLLLLFLNISLLAENLSLTGEYIQMNGNPYKNFFIKNKPELGVASKTNDVVLNVETNLNKNSFIPVSQFRDSYVVNNKDVKKVASEVFSEDYKVINGSDVEINIIKGIVKLTFSEPDKISASLRDIEVILTI